MNKSLLITRPEHDDTTHYLSNWSLDSIELAKSKSIEVLDLKREKANKTEVEGRIKKLKPGLIVLNGHGDDRTVSGHKNLPIIKVGENEGLLKSAITYAISCSSAKILGPRSIDSGATSYIGYDDDFVFFYEPNNISRPLEDKTAKLFLEPSQELMNALVKGNAVEEAHSRAKSLLRANVSKLMSSGASKEAGTYVRYLWWDFIHLKLLGDSKATF